MSAAVFYAFEEDFVTSERIVGQSALAGLRLQVALRRLLRSCDRTLLVGLLLFHFRAVLGTLVTHLRSPRTETGWMISEA